MKAVIDDISVNGCVCVPLKLYFQKQEGQNWPEVSNLLISRGKDKKQQKKLQL